MTPVAPLPVEIGPTHLLCSEVASQELEYFSQKNAARRPEGYFSVKVLFYNQAAYDKIFQGLKLSSSLWCAGLSQARE